ncbi:hypothetical protein C0Q70_05592 [Pomacea canaliculata]|uniref:Uncharacterized protein n=1 Tax=Pomacea canaliculata TaxID=400727 RepID=A0A2T7PLL7_POMCA|nr:hypothetical protein C0Q70_05592 [Pomacea canaliculata]
MLSRTATLARRTRRKSAGASRYGTRLTRDQHRKRRASAPILSPQQQRPLMRLPSPISRSAETVAREGFPRSLPPPHRHPPARACASVWRWRR